MHHVGSISSLKGDPACCSMHGDVIGGGGGLVGTWDEGRPRAMGRVCMGGGGQTLGRGGKGCDKGALGEAARSTLTRHCLTRILSFPIPHPSPTQPRLPVQTTSMGPGGHQLSGAWPPLPPQGPPSLPSYPSLTLPSRFVFRRSWRHSGIWKRPTIPFLGEDGGRVLSLGEGRAD